MTCLGPPLGPPERSASSEEPPRLVVDINKLQERVCSRIRGEKPEAHPVVWCDRLRPELEESSAPLLETLQGSLDPDSVERQNQALRDGLPTQWWLWQREAKEKPPPGHRVDLVDYLLARMPCGKSNPELVMKATSLANHEYGGLISSWTLVLTVTSTLFASAATR